MEAPLEAYFTDEDGHPVVLVRNSSSGQLRTFVAKLLRGAEADGGYGDPVTAVMLRSLFQLDYFETVRVRDSDGTVRAGFLGAVQMNSVNAKRRDMSRRDSGVRLRRYVGSTEYVYALLNDAGLNVIPGAGCAISVDRGATDVGNYVVPNFLTLRYTVINAFYGTAGYALHVMRGSVGYELLEGSLLPNERRLSLTLRCTLPSGFAAGNIVHFRLTLSNTEGSSVLRTQAYTLLPEMEARRAYVTPTRLDPWNEGTGMTLYFGSRDLEWLLSQTPPSTSNVTVDASDLPDGGRVYERIESTGTFREITQDGDYNIASYIGFQYSRSLGRIRYVYQPNAQTVEGRWRVIVFAQIEYYEGGGWPEWPSRGNYPYRIAVAARYEAVGSPSSQPGSVRVSGFGIRAVDSSGNPVTALQFNDSAFADGTYLVPHSSTIVESTADDQQYYYARSVPGSALPYGIEITCSEVEPPLADMQTEVTPLSQAQGISV